MTTNNPQDADIERLIHRAGSRTTPDAVRTTRVRSAIKTEWRLQVAPKRRNLSMLLAGAGLAAAAAIAVFAWTPTRQTPAEGRGVSVGSFTAVRGSVSMATTGEPHRIRTGQFVPKRAEITLDAGASAALRLDDGAEMRLDEESAVSMLDLGTIALTRGRIYLDSGGAPPRRFAVRTPAGLVTDIGTQFEVGAANGVVTVRVRDGSVEVANGGAIRHVPTGFELTAAEGAAMSMRPFDVFDPRWSWITQAAPEFVVEGASLEAFLRWAAAEGGWKIVWTDSLRRQAKATVLHGDVRGLTPAEALAVVLPTCGLTPEIRGASLRVVARIER